jgi:rhodanese-related sulfurtransferase
MEMVTPAQALEMVESGAAYGIDVREIDEWDAGHFEMFTLNALSTFDANALPTDKPIIFICRSGNRSGKACAAVEPTGLKVMNMEGGMLAWQAAGLPMSAKHGTPQIS